VGFVIAKKCFNNPKGVWQMIHHILIVANTKKSTIPRKSMMPWARNLVSSFQIKAFLALVKSLKNHGLATCMNMKKNERIKKRLGVKGRREKVVRLPLH